MPTAPCPTFGAWTGAGGFLTKFIRADPGTGGHWRGFWGPEGHSIRASWPGSGPSPAPPPPRFLWLIARHKGLSGGFRVIMRHRPPPPIGPRPRRWARHSWSSSFFLLAAAALAALVSPGPPRASATDATAMAELKNVILYDGWTSRSGDPCDINPSLWPAVTCSEGSVTSIDFSDVGVTLLPSALDTAFSKMAAFANLNTLGLVLTDYSGTLPTSIGRLANLVSLSLKGAVVCNLASELGGLLHLKSLSLTRSISASPNECLDTPSPTIPNELGSLVGLTSLSLALNSAFVGTSAPIFSPPPISFRRPLSPLCRPLSPPCRER